MATCWLISSKDLADVDGQVRTFGTDREVTPASHTVDTVPHPSFEISRYLPLRGMRHLGLSRSWLRESWAETAASEVGIERLVVSGGDALEVSLDGFPF